MDGITAAAIGAIAGSVVGAGAAAVDIPTAVLALGAAFVALALQGGQRACRLIRGTGRTAGLSAHAG